MYRFSLILFFILNTFVCALSAQNQNDQTELNIHEQIICNLIKSSVSHRDSSLNFSVEICDKAIKLAVKEEADSLLALAFKTQGINYYYLRDYDSSKIYYNKALAKFDELGDQIQVGKVLGNIGVVYNAKGSYNKALEYYLKEVEVFVGIKHTAGLIPIYLNMGNLSVKMDNYSRAEKYYNSALELAVQTENLANQMNALNNLGVIYEKQNKFKDALEAYEESLSLVLHNGNSVMKSKLYLNIGIIYRRLKEYDRATTYLNKSFDIRKLRGNYEELLSVYNEMFEIDLAQKNYTRARHLIGTMQDLAEMNQDSGWLGDIYKAHYSLYKEIGNYRLALESYENFRIIGDSIQAALNEEKYDELMMRYDMDQTRQKMELMAQETKIQNLEIDKKNAWIVAMLVIMLLGIIAIVVSFRINKLKAEHKLMSLDQKVLLSQMNPHFLFNALTAVQSLVFDNEKDKANLYLAELATLVRSILEDSRKENISLKQELNTLEKYIDLQKLRFDYPLKFSFDIDENIDLEELRIPPMLTQPFIENALVHANLQEVENPEIAIRLKLIDNRFVEFCIQDNGIGIEEGKKQYLMKEKESLATQIAHDRIQIYNFKSKYQMKLDVVDLKHIYKDSHGTLARFTIPTQA